MNTLYKKKLNVGGPYRFIPGRVSRVVLCYFTFEKLLGINKKLIQREIKPDQ